ncbi:MAG: MBL fold metallo-hydrolase [Hungatella sp.]|nr:MBL fold metallo-hydrolase [Hungatella sp.]
MGREITPEMRKRMEEREQKYKDFFLNPYKYYIKPFRIFGNVYYVGDAKVCMHLIDTGEGLILMDTGFPHTKHQVIQAIWEAGFNPRDIKITLLTHGHFDHYGAAVQIKGLYGCKLAVSEGDAPLIVPMMPMKGTLPVEEYPIEPFEPDIIIHERESLTLGKTTIETIPVPGHSPGTLAFFFDAVDENGEKKRCGMIGGIGLGGMSMKRIREKGESPDKQTNFLKALDEIYDQKVDIVLGNHPENNRTCEKREQMLADPDMPNPFIDPQEWHRLIDGLRAKMARIMEDNDK